MFENTRAYLKKLRRGKGRTNPVGYFPHKSGQGPQECARRVRQSTPKFLQETQPHETWCPTYSNYRLGCNCGAGSV